MAKAITMSTQRYPITGESRRTPEIEIMTLCGAGTNTIASPAAAMNGHGLLEPAMRYAQEKAKKETAGPKITMTIA